MGKLISAYAGLTPLQIKNKATAGISDMVVVGNDVDCTNIKITGVKTAIGESVNGLASLCQSANVNPYSGFGPRQWNLGNGVLQHSVKTPFQLGYFAGYNHNAVTPGISVDDLTALNTDYKFNFYAFVSFGEYDFRDASGATEVVCKVKDGTTTIATYYADISASDYLNGVVFSGEINNPSNHSNFTVEAYFAGAGHVKICDIPNVSTTPFTVTITTYVPPQNGILGGVSLNADFLAEYPNAMLFEDNPNSSISASMGTYNIKILGVDTDMDGIADLAGITFPLYAQKNLGTPVYCGTIRPSRALQVGSSGSLPFSIIGTDTVYFEIGV